MLGFPQCREADVAMDVGVGWGGKSVGGAVGVGAEVGTGLASAVSDGGVETDGGTETETGLDRIVGVEIATGTEEQLEDRRAVELQEEDDILMEGIRKGRDKG